MVEPDADFEALLEFLRDSRGFDFTGYKRNSLMRRMTKRMARIGVEGFEDYLDYLQVHPTEFSELFNEILINVTSFFRDPEAWDYLASNVLPVIARRADGDGPIRCWCAGVASGEEAYTLAMLLAEAAGTSAFAERVKIYATDVDDEALTQARPGGHTQRDLEGVPPDLRDRYFERVGNRYLIRADMRRAIIFGRHDLVQDAPISRLDLLICRNALMYFTAEMQGRILARFHYALKETGYLFLGKAEMMLTHGDLFTPVDIRYRIFRKVSKSGVRDRLAVMAQANSGDGVGEPRSLRLLLRAGDAQAAGQVVVDPDGRVVVINQRARAWFRLSQRDVGRPLQDLEISYRPIELRSMIEKACSERREVVSRNVERALGDMEVQYFDVQVMPLIDSGSIMGASVTYNDVTGYNRLQVELDRSRQELETAYEELQSTNEELETTNEELQSTVEELETTNEELQSSNEELETMNEELESTNTELQAVNHELRLRTRDVEEGNAFLESVLTSLQLAVIVVDPELRVRLWRGRAEDMWGLRATEVQDQPLASLDIGLPVGDVRKLVNASLGNPNHVELAEVDATNRRGRPIHCRMVASGLRGEVTTTGVILLIEEIGAEAAAR
jgi:two-component system, chemotaxis family, CheB/CheR fusion protein